jgi:hypothetical protein
MKKMIKYSNYFGFVLAICVMVISGCSCSAPKPTPDPLVGFHFCGSQDPNKLNKAITDDYKVYIQTLSPEEQKNADLIFFYEDGTGQHAVQIKIPLNGIWYEHDLFYDKDNKRIKVIKRITGGYQS